MIELLSAKHEQLETLRNLMQLYLYDFSVYRCDEPDEKIGEDGYYHLDYDLARYFNNPGFRAYLAQVDRKLAGFVLVSSRVHYHDTGWNIDEFFVLRCYRRQGVGRFLAHKTFDTYRGYWEITQIPNNLPAQAFWRRVIDDYSGGRYQEIIGEYGKVCQIFDSSGW